MTPQITRIVLTGGPCAGKTTALSTLTRELEHDGKVVAIVPEVPTILFANRFSARSALTDVERVEYVRQMCLVQVVLEDAMLSSLEMECERQRRPGVLLYDRGVLDNKAYVSPSVWRRVWGSLPTTHTAVERYDIVIHMQSAAVGAPDHYHQNAVRNESVEKAAVLDEKTLVAWTEHPHIRVIDNSTDFKGKIDRVVATIRNDLTARVAFQEPPTPAPGTTCGFDEAWVGACKNAIPCARHDKEYCRCGAKATQNCSATIGPLVCGAPLCGRCRCH